MHTITLFVVALLFAAAFAVPSSKSFTTDMEIVEQDGSSGKVTWNYDYRKNAESLVFHREGLAPTTNVRLYTHSVEFLVIENECYVLPLNKAMPTPTERIATFSSDKALLRWTNTAEGPVDPSLFAIPSSCE